MSLDRRCYTLQPLILKQLLIAGRGKLTCSVGGVEYLADLGANGEISFEGQVFRSPSSFSVYVKRKLNPLRKADDGWTSVKYEGTPLAVFRQQMDDWAASGGSGAPGDYHRSSGHRQASGQSPSVGGSLGAVPRKRRPMARQREPSLSDTDHEDAGLASPEEDYSWENSAEEYGNADGLEGRHAKQQPWARPHGSKAAADNGQMSSRAGVSWVQCERAGCRKWRRAQPEHIPSGRWECSMNVDPRFDSCDAPQEREDGEAAEQAAARALPARASGWHMAYSQRPPLQACTEDDFEADLMAFMEGQGQYGLARLIRDNRVTCNNTPLDFFGLYKEVVRQGGFLPNERYDDFGRWQGSINFAGTVFPRLRNWTPNNRATSVGNQLLSNYRKFLLGYEKEWASRDLAAGGSGHAAASSGGAGITRRRSLAAGSQEPEDEGAEAWQRPTNRRRRHSPGKADHEEEEGLPPQLSSAHALAFLADVASARGQLSPPAAVARPGKRFTENPVAPVVDGALPQLLPSTAFGEPDGYGDVLAALHAVEQAPPPGRPVPGELLLVRDPNHPARLWPVVMASSLDLPLVVAMGGAMALGPDPVAAPVQSLQEPAPASRVQRALPVLAMAAGSTSGAVGWVQAADCRPFHVPTVAAAMAFELAAAPDLRPAGRGRPQHPAAACATALKFALQVHQAGRGVAEVHASGTCMLAPRLLSLEAALPQAALGCSAPSFWAGWRRAIAGAETPAELAPSLLALMHQLSPQALLPGLRDDLWRSVLSATGVAPPEALALLPMPSAGPTSLGMDTALGALEAALDWPAIHGLWRPAPPMPAGADPLPQETGPARPQNRALPKIVAAGAELETRRSCSNSQTYAGVASKPAVSGSNDCAAGLAAPASQMAEQNAAHRPHRLSVQGPIIASGDVTAAAAKATSYLPTAEGPSRATMPTMAVPGTNPVVKPPAAVVTAVIRPSQVDTDRQPSTMSGQTVPSANVAPPFYQVPTGWTLGPGIGQLLQLAVATGQLQQLAQQQQGNQRAQQDLEQALEHQLPAALVAKTPVHASSAAAETAAAIEIDPGSAESSGVKENNPSPANNWVSEVDWPSGQQPHGLPAAASMPSSAALARGTLTGMKPLTAPPDRGQEAVQP